MPSLGADMTEGSVLEWLVQPGDRVHRGDLVAVIKTDKADVEAEAFDDGVIGELLVPVGDDLLPIGTPLATICDGEDAAPAPTSPEVAPAITSAPPPPEPPPPSPPAALPTAIVLPPVGTDRIAASPYARRRAAEMGIDIASVASGRPGHPIRAADVERAAAEAPVVARVPVDQASAMRRAIGNLMARSKREIPHYYLEEDIELTHTMAWLAHYNERVSVEDAHPARGDVVQGRRGRRARDAGAERLLVRRGVCARRRRAPRRRDRDAGRRPRRAGNPRRRRVLARRPDGSPA